MSKQCFTSSRLLIKMLNRIGPRTDPCATRLNSRSDHNFLSPITQPLFTHLIVHPSRPWYLACCEVSCMCIHSARATPQYLSLCTLLLHDNNHGVTNILHVHVTAGLTVPFPWSQTNLDRLAISLWALYEVLMIQIMKSLAEGIFSLIGLQSLLAGSRNSNKIQTRNKI